MTSWLTLALSLTGCSGSTPTSEPAADAAPELPELSKDDLQASAENTALVPSPMETQRALKAAGIETKLSELVPKHQFDLKNADLEHAAVRTGVFLADLMLTVEVADKADVITRLSAVRSGIGQLQGGNDIDVTLKEYEEAIQADAMSREEMLKEFDELSGAVIPELEFNGRARVVPLIKAGSWLEGANLMARAVKATGKPEAADGLLKQPQVVEYFIRYVKEDAEGTPPQVAAKLEESLLVLKGLAEKSGSLTLEDIDTVIQVTSDVLALL